MLGTYKMNESMIKTSLKIGVTSTIDKLTNILTTFTNIKACFNLVQFKEWCSEILH